MTTQTQTPAAPARSLEQRMDALRRANVVRSYRAAVKRDLKAGRLDLGDLLHLDETRLERPDLLAGAHIFDVLIATPKIGRVKANRLLARARVSPSKTLGGLTIRQRAELLALRADFGRRRYR